MTLDDRMLAIYSRLSYVCGRLLVCFIERINAFSISLAVYACFRSKLSALPTHDLHLCYLFELLHC